MRRRLQLADEILAGGESSRLYQSLVYRAANRTAGVSFNADLHEDLGLAHCRASFWPAANHPLEAEKALSEQIDKVLKDGVTRGGAGQGKELVSSPGKLLERETNNGKASALGEAAVIYGDAESREYRPGRSFRR